MNLSVLVMTCDKNSDISNFLIETILKFKECSVNEYISTETNALPYSDFNCSCSSSSFSKRMVECLEKINEDYVLVLLDDYFVFDSDLLSKTSGWLNEICENNLSVLKICNDGKLYKKIKKSKKGTKIYKKINVYDIDFHPTIWKKDVLIDVLRQKDLSPWQIEPLFSKYLSAGNFVCGISKNKIKYEELIVKGRFFRVAFKKYCKNKYLGNRKRLTLIQDVNFRIKRFVRHITPRFVINIAKKITGKKGYSDC